MKQIKKLYDFIMFFQICLFFLYFLENLYTLDSIPLTFDYSDESTTYSSETLNFYSLIGVVVAIMMLGIIASMSFFGSGLNSEGTRLTIYYLSTFALYSVLFISTHYFMAPLGTMGSIVETFIVGIYAIYLLINVGGGDYND